MKRGWMKEPFSPKTNSVMVLSAAAATGHLRAADALVAAFAARGVFARHVAQGGGVDESSLPTSN
jgi:hypothetical protein